MKSMLMTVVVLAVTAFGGLSFASSAQADAGCCGEKCCASCPACCDTGCCGGACCE